MRERESERDRQTGKEVGKDKVDLRGVVKAKREREMEGQ